ncbi:MAG: imidazolonepropionase [Ignavibacteriota bacterium]|nr:imidazolonepropionase [Ignavibacteriales bacterium]MBL1124432.1 imidazolonepropionase [Ignavibacteriota bacterium]MCC7093854.1 imidazolonepropionase [Ignavibacteriaceae bacterium]MCE7857316.1 imidazolonepropionase [Ignavibacteria bacterium CHB3]MCL4278450.1 imidazolonepropionase [Ignavibacteriaceae bacterium]
MKKLLFNPASVITVNTSGKNYKRGKELSEIGCLDNHSIVIEDDLIKDIVSTASIDKKNFDEVIDLTGKTVLPGLVECHTHTAFAGSRADEFRQKLRGIGYEEIAKKGGGINTTVTAVRSSSFEELVNIIKPRIDHFISQGITTLEIKSGYGLNFENERKLLQVINFLDEIYPIDIIPTFLGAHTFPKEHKENHQAYVEEITEKMIPHFAEQKLDEFCDGFCESTAFSANEMDEIFTTAKSYGLKLKLHTDQFNSIGGLDIALKHKAISVDHLEVIKDEDVPKLGQSETVAVLLPGVSFFLNHQFAPARKLIDQNAIVALATDYNPGSSHISSLSLIMSIAALKMKMTIEETISAVTINSAKALCREKSIGSIEIGKKADFAVLNTTDYADIVYSIGSNLNCMTIKAGNVIYHSAF